MCIKTRKTAGTAESPACHQTPLCDIQIKGVINCRQIYVCIPYRSPTNQHLSDLDSDLSRPLKVKYGGLGSPYMVSY